MVCKHCHSAMVTKEVRRDPIPRTKFYEERYLRCACTACVGFVLIDLTPTRAEKRIRLLRKLGHTKAFNQLVADHRAWIKRQKKDDTTERRRLHTARRLLA
ncbi:MAG: hypothetical protein HY348_09035 [Nitrospira defluvii]|nr:hypothetical protein [Nitrospira defluvii]